MIAIKKVKFTTTLKLLKEFNACKDGLNTLLQSLPENFSENKQINLLHILESNSVDHFFWALRALKTKPTNYKKVIRYILADIIEVIEPNFSKRSPNDLSVKNVIKYLRKGTPKQLQEAGRAAESAANRAANHVAQSAALEAAWRDA
ncbi:MAG: hypothetical protein AABY22_03365, partial [Nanoarchaeota archaeon]